MVERLREKYEVILGFVTLVISLSAFKDELSAVIVDLGWTTFSLATYLLYCVYGFSLCLYLYVSESFLRETRAGRWKWLGAILWLAAFLFGFILLTPILVLVNVLFYKAYLWVSDGTNKAANVLPIVASGISALSGLVSTWLLVRRWIQDRKRRATEAIERREIIELEHAKKLFDTGFYSHSILESFKALESHLYRKLTELDYRVSPSRFDELMAVSRKIALLREDDIPGIQDVRGMRNISAHVADAELTQGQAQFALDLVRGIIRRTAGQRTDND